MPLTAPDVSTASPNYYDVSYRFIDASGDERTITLRTTAEPTPAQIQALAAAFGAASNANLWAVQVTSSYNAVAQASGADKLVYPSVYDNIVFLFGGVAGNSLRTFLPAPVEETVNDNDQPDITSPLLTAISNAALNILDPGAVDYQLKSLRFTERREKNEAVKA